MTNATETKRDRIGEAIKKHGAFFAFSQNQFNEQKTEAVRYINMGSGLLCPKESHEQLIKDINKAGNDNITDDLKKNGKKEIIHRELANHEACITYSINDTVEALYGYGITREEVQAEFKEYINNHIKWEEEQDAKANN